MASGLNISSNARVVTIVPNKPLAVSGIYYIIATTAIRNLGGGNKYDDTSETGAENTSIPGI